MQVNACRYYSGEEEISVDALIEEQRILARSKNPIERVVGSLCIGASLKERLCGCQTAPLAD